MLAAVAAERYVDLLRIARHIPTYSRWLAQQDWTPAYLRHRKNLQLIGLNDPGKRWVLKNPSHLFALDALMAAYPDALVIQTHRAPSTIIASMCSLAEHATPWLVDDLHRRPDRTGPAGAVVPRAS